MQCDPLSLFVMVKMTATGTVFFSFYWLMPRLQLPVNNKRFKCKCLQTEAQKLGLCMFCFVMFINKLMKNPPPYTHCHQDSCHHHPACSDLQQPSLILLSLSFLIKDSIWTPSHFLLLCVCLSITHAAFIVKGRAKELCWLRLLIFFSSELDY